MRIIQMLPAMAPGDAVSNDAAALQQILRSYDPNTRIYATLRAKNLPEGACLPAERLPRLKKEDVIVFHMAVGDEISNQAESQDCRKLMIYHNITPGRFFAPYSSYVADSCAAGRTELHRLRGQFDYCIADSEYNRLELEETGFRCPTATCPVWVDFASMDGEPDPTVMKKYSDGRTNILFVGRVVPNKKQEDVIRAFAYYQKTYDSTARLILAGVFWGKAYYRRLCDYVRALGVRNVCFTGFAPQAELLAYYRTASAFLCMSEHEGFCVPLLEAMHFEVPVVACAAAAIPGTLGGSGVLLPDKDPAAAAAALYRVITDKEHRAAVIASQNERLKIYTPQAVEARFRELFEDFLNRPAPDTRPKVVQMVPVLKKGDAVSNHILALRRVLDTLPCRESVWARLCEDRALKASVHTGEQPPALSEKDIAVYHLAAGDRMAEDFLDLKCRKVIVYHSVTPPEYMDPYSAPYAAACRQGMKQAARLVKAAEKCIAVSDFDRRELQALGAAGDIPVLPILTPFDEYKAAPDDTMTRLLSDGRTNILFVGRLAPNKKQEDVIRAFLCYKARYNPSARLILAGAADSVPAYTARLKEYISRLDAADDVLLTGSLPFAELLACYRCASAFLCLSEHEGFCVPLTESMALDVPVVALDRAAVGETLGGAGVLLDSADPETVAAALHRVISDPAFRGEILAGQAERLKTFATDTVEARAREIFSALLGGEA